MDTTSPDRQGGASSRAEEGGADTAFMLLSRLSPQALLIVDHRRLVGWLNPAAERLFARPEGAARGRRVDELLVPPQPEQAGASFDWWGRMTGGPEETWHALRPDGSTFPVSIHRQPVRHRLGDHALFIQDICELRETQRRHRELQIELMQAFRLLGSTRAALNLAQELSQPLSAISSYLSGSRLRLERRENERALQAIGKAAEQLERAGQIVRGMRELGRRGDAARRPCELSQLIRRAVDRALAWKPRDWARLEEDIEPATRMVLVDDRQILPVFTELIRAALDAAPDGRPRQLQIAALPVSADFTEISIVSGWRRPDPRGEEQPAEEGEDSVRLSLCRAIIEDYGGRLLVARDPGEAAFRLTLPAAA